MFVPRFGHVEDPYDARDLRGLDKLLGASAGASASVYTAKIDYRPFALFVERQQPAQDCTGEFVCAAIDTQARIVNPSTTQPYGSPLAAYAIGRSLTIGNYRLPLSDSGAYPRDVVRGAAKYGVVRLDRWDDSSDPLERVPVDVLGGARVERYTRIEGDDVVGQFALALSHGFIPSLPMPVDQAFVDVGGQIYTGVTGPVLGRHIMPVVGCDLSGMGDIAHFIVGNYWTKRWADGGFCRIAASVVASQAVTDRWVLRTTPWPA